MPRRRSDLLRKAQKRTLGGMTRAAENPMQAGPDSVDHRAQADALQAEIYRRMTPARRLEIAVAMQRQMRDLMDAGLRMAHPEWTGEKRRREIARRILYART